MIAVEWAGELVSSEANDLKGSGAFIETASYCSG